MAKTKSIKGEGLVGSSIGSSAVTNTGNYAIMATLTGSYGEKVHRIVGGNYWHPLRCAEKAVKLHLKDGYQDVEFVNLITGVRTPVAQFIKG